MRSTVHFLLLLAVLGLPCLPSWAQNRPVSQFARKAPRLDGAVNWGEWDGATRLNFDHGFVALRNDNERLYLLVDVLGAREPDPRDYLWLSFDVDGDGAISPNRDLNYTFEPETRNFRYQHYLGPGEWTTLRPSTCSSKAEVFGSFLADGSTLVDLPKFVSTTSPHRVWELAIDLAEINARPGGKVRFGLRVASPAQNIVDEMPARFSQDFGKLIEIDLSKFGPLLDGGADPKAVAGLQADPIEVTQAVQNRQNTLPLVKAKSTVARVYVSVTGTTEAQPVTVCLFGRRGTVDLPGSPLFKRATVPPVVNRARLNDTPSFALPPSWTEGTVTLRAQVRHFYSGDTLSGPVTVTFTPKEIPTYWIVPLNYGSAASPVIASSSEIASQQSYLKTVYPVPDVNFTVKPWTAIGTVSASDPMPVLNNYFDQVFLGWLLGLIFTGTSPFDLPTQVYGFRPSGGGLSDPVWCAGRGYVAWGFRGTSLEGTMAHEINHNLDRDVSGSWGHHTPFGCGAIGPDPSWPYPNSNIQEVGVDVRPPLDNDNAVALNFPDYMAYCQSGASPTKWISPYRWNNLFNVFPNAAAFSAADDQARVQALLARVETVYYLSGSLNINGAGRLNPVLVQPGMPTEAIARGEYAIELLDANGALLRSIPFMVSFVDVEGNAVDLFSFNYQIAAQQGVAEIVLRHGAAILDTIKISRSAPAVVVREPNGGEIWNGLEQIAWAGEDADGDALFFDIYYTPNDGASWLPVAKGVRGDTYEVDSNLLPGGTKARIRVIATDGFNTSQDDSDRTFTVAGKAPRPLILQPQPDAPLVAGELIPFETDAGDLEDGTLPDSSCFWSYRGMVFGIGRKVEACLPEGNHEVMLTLADGDGNVSEQMMPTRVSLGGPTLYLNCGGTADLTDAVGRVWKPADPFLAFGHPAVNTFTATGQVNTALLSDLNVPGAVLLSEHWRDGNLAYQIPVADGDYRVVLYFSENYPPAVSPGLGGTGCASCARVFNVQVEDQQVSEYNPADAALLPANDGKGKVFAATELKFDVSVKDRVLDVQLVDLGAGNPPENPSLKGICVFNTRLGRLQAGRNPDGSIKLSWPISIGGTLQMARDVRGPYENYDAPARQDGDHAAVNLPLTAPLGFYRLMLAP